MCGKTALLPLCTIRNFSLNGIIPHVDRRLTSILASHDNINTVLEKITMFWLLFYKEEVEWREKGETHGDGDE